MDKILRRFFPEGHGTKMSGGILALWVLFEELTGIDVPDDIQSAVTVLLSYLVLYFLRDAVNRPNA